MLHLMDLESLKAFVSFADAACNLTVAGRAIGVSQPAMHARLQGVARSLDVGLYERRGRRLVLTREGTRVLAWARDVLERERALRSDLKGGSADERLVIACGEGALVHIVADRIAAWVRAHPGAVSFLVADGLTAVESVRRGDAHVAIVAGPASQAPDLKSDTLLTTSLCAVAPRTHPSVRGDAIDVEALLAHALLLPPIGRPLRSTFEDAASARNLSVRVAAEITGWEAVARLSKLAIGVGIVNDVIETPGLGRALVRGLPKTTYRLLSRRGRPTGALHDVMEALLVRQPDHR